MATVFLSFTTLCRDILYKKIQIEVLKDCLFFFGCSMDHALGEVQYLIEKADFGAIGPSPMCEYLTFVRRDLMVELKRMPTDAELKAAAQPLAEQIQAALREANAEGRILWRQDRDEWQERRRRMAAFFKLDFAVLETAENSLAREDGWDGESLHNELLGYNTPATERVLGRVRPDLTCHS